MAQVTRDKTMDVSPLALYRAITDYEAYPEFLSEVKSATRLPKGKTGKTLVRFEIEVVKKFDYTLEFSEADSSTVNWRLVESNFFKTNTGVWKLKPKGDRQTEVHYELEVAFGFLVPGWISKKLTEVNLPKMFEAFEGQAKKLESSK